MPRAPVHTEEAITTSEHPTAKDIARALANHIAADIPVRDVIGNFRVRPQTASRYGHRSSGAPVSVIAESLHAELYGLPIDRDDAPMTLADLADTAHQAHAHDEQDAVLAHLVDQLPHLADVLDLAATWAERRTNVPEHVAGWIASAAGVTHQMGSELAQAHRAFTQPRPAPAPVVSPPARPASSPAARPGRR